jgi:hypothetical protein
MFNTEQYKEVIPPALLDGLVAWGKKQHQVGGFLTSFLSNDLRETMMRADPHSKKALPHLVQFAYWELPSGCHGSAEKVETWSALIDELNSESEQDD